jgi:hypothetical protein
MESTVGSPGAGAEYGRMRSTKHRALVAQIVDRMRRGHTKCGMILMASVPAGRERPDSDLDFFVIARGQVRLPRFRPRLLHSEKGMRLLESRIEGVTVHFSCWSSKAFERTASEAPFTLYPMACGEIVYDPGGAAGKVQARLRRYFRARPAVAAAWRRQLAALARYKATGKGTLRFCEWGQFAAHLGKTFGAESDQGRK